MCVCMYTFIYLFQIFCVTVFLSSCFITYLINIYEDLFISPFTFVSFCFIWFEAFFIRCMYIYSHYILLMH